MNSRSEWKEGEGHPYSKPLQAKLNSAVEGLRRIKTTDGHRWTQIPALPRVPLARELSGFVVLILPNPGLLLSVFICVHLWFSIIP
jgi:hypothetical protein